MLGALITTIVLHTRAPVYRQAQRKIFLHYDAAAEEWKGPLELSYTFERLIIGVFESIAVVVVVPMVLVLFMQLFVRSSRDAYAAITGCSKALTLSSVAWQKISACEKCKE